MKVAVTLLGVATLGACATSRTSLSRTRALLDGGDLRAACCMAREQVDDRPKLSRAQRLDALRYWIECLSRRGRLADAQRWVSRQSSPTADIMYAEALVAVTRTAAALPRSLKLLEMAARAWPEQPELSYRRGMLLLADDQAEAALPHLRRACRLAPHARCVVAAAHALLDLNRPQEALKEVRRIVALNPRPVDLSRGRALIRRLRRRRRIPQGARQRYRRALKLDDRPGEMVRVLRGVLADFPELAQAHTLLGLAHLKLGNTADALVSFRRAAELDPLDPANPLYAGLVLKSQGHLKRAAHELGRALELDPFAEPAALELGRAWFQLKRYQQAAAAFDHLVAIHPGVAERRRAVEAHIAAGSLSRAEYHLERLLADDAKDYESHLKLAQVLVQRYQEQRRRSTSEESAGSLLRRAKTHVAAAKELEPKSSEARALQQVLDRLP